MDDNYITEFNTRATKQDILDLLDQIDNDRLAHAMIERRIFNTSEDIICSFTIHKLRKPIFSTDITGKEYYRGWR